MWINREISSEIENNVGVIQIIRGPRQCGKSSLFLHLDPTFKELSLDDPSLRQLAQQDPELFLDQFKSEKIFIDEAQYAPELFPSLKRRVDLFKRNNTELKTIIRITGSNQILMDKNVKESLSGRATFYDLNTLSVSEILAAKNKSIQEILYIGGWPELYAREGQLDTKKYLDDYINSYVEKDVVLSAGIQKSREFLIFLKLLAGRVGEIVDFSSLGNDAGVDSKTIKTWISLLESMHIISLAIPYFSNLSKRLIKSPKVYFLDTGIACRLQGWTSSGPILTSPQQGHLFENLVYCEILKFSQNYQLGLQIFFWRTRDGEEIDFIVQNSQGKTLMIEVKVTAQKLKSLSSFKEVGKVFQNNLPEIIQVHQNGDQILGNNVPISCLKSMLAQKYL